MLNVTAVPAIALLFVASLSPDSHGFIYYQSKKNPVHVSECLHTLISKDLVDVNVIQHNGVYRLTNKYGFYVEIGKSISSDQTLVRFRVDSRAIDDDKYLKMIRSCL